MNAFVVPLVFVCTVIAIVILKLHLFSFLASCFSLLHQTPKVPNSNQLNIVNMNPSVDSQIGPLESGGHPPVYGRKRKTTTRSTKKESTRSGGVAAPMNPDVDLASSTNAPSSYTIGNLDEKTELGKIFATQARSQVLSIRTAKSDNFTKGEDERHRGSSDTSATGDRPSHTSHGNQMSGDKHEDDQSQNDDSQHIPGDGSDDDDQGRDSSIDEHNIGQLEDDTVQHAIDDESASSYQGDQEPVQRYGAESRLYHAYYDEVGASTYHPSL